MESAIAKHLQCPRTLGHRVDDENEPPSPQFVGRASEGLAPVVSAYLGVSDDSSQQFEYLDCHPNTGMLRDARALPA